MTPFQKILTLGALLFGSISNAADSCGCVAQDTFSGFEYSQHGGAYDSPYSLPGGEAEGLFWGLSETRAWSSQDGYNDRIYPSSWPYQLYFKEGSDIRSNYISTLQDSFYHYTPMNNFVLHNFNFGCTRLQPYKLQNGTTVTAEVPVSCSLKVSYSDSFGESISSNYTASYTAKIEKQNSYDGLPWAYSTRVDLPPTKTTYNTILLSVGGKLAGDAKVTVYADSFNHTNYYCPGYVNPG